MELNSEFGLNLLDNLLRKAFEEYECDRLDIVAFNVDLDYLSGVFESYDSLSEVNIYSNTEKIKFKHKNSKKVSQLLKSNKIKVYTFSKNEKIIHSKAYRFWKDGEVVFGAVGSPNFSAHSNQNFESFLYVPESELLNNLWTKLEEVCEKHSCALNETSPENIIQREVREKEIDNSYLEGLWQHQKHVLKWLVKRKKGIINIPPGAGKTRISLTQVNHMLDKNEKMTLLVLVPTTPLIPQWKDNLTKWSINNYEYGTSVDKNVEPYFRSPNGKAVITLYSRIFDQYEEFTNHLKINAPKNIVIISDECQKWYNHLEDFTDFNKQLSLIEEIENVYHIGLSATIQSFNEEEVKKYIELMGGEQNRYRISLSSFYSEWNDLNSEPVLKPIKYYPLRYSLTPEQMKTYRKKSQWVGIEASKRDINGNEEFRAAIDRARWVRNLEGGAEKLKDFLGSHISKLNKNNVLIFVQTHEIAEEMRNFIVSHPGWNEESSAYIYDSRKGPMYQKYAMKQFKENKGFCLLSERMLREGFDLPKISSVVIHGSYTSPRDWLQKIGRAIRYDSDKPKSVAEIIDIVYCNSNGKPLDMEEERYEVLSSVSV